MDINRIAMTTLLGLVVAILNLIFNRSLDYMWQPLRVDHKMKRLREAMKNLKTRHNDVRVQVSRAELELKTCNDEVKCWLEKVKSMEDEMNDLEEEYSSWRSDHGSVYHYLIFWKRYSIGYKAVDKLREVAKIHDQGGFKDVATKLPPPTAQELPSTPRVWAMDSNRDQILQHLNNDEVKIIGIWGMGGVGKTTLLKLINNYLAQNHLPSFNHVIYVIASKGVNIEVLQKKILRSLELPSGGDDDINSRATYLFNFLKRKKVLLLLDDLWEYVNLINLGIPLGQGICKVIFTTRSINMCGSMKADTELEVKVLNMEEAWSLFEDNVGVNIINADLNIARIAKEVVEECCGLPLALITIGRAMSSKKTWKEWQNALNLLRSSRSYEIVDMPDTMFSTLELSYQNLQDDTVRECFLSCSMWPEDCNIPKDDLIICWMGLGLIDDYSEINEAFDKGHSIIGSLIRACLMESAGYGDHLKFSREVDDCVRMHDVLRDLALWISSDHGKNKNKWLVKAGLGLKDCKAENWEGAERISLMHNNIKSLPRLLMECRKLSVLLLNGNDHLNSIPQGLCHCLTSVRYLDLNGSPINDLPKEVSELTNLEFLNLVSTEIKYLPNELSKLVKLKYLLLGYTRIKSIPWKLISALPNLKMLDLFRCEEAIDMESQHGFEALERLDGRLMGLGINVHTVSALSHLSMFSTISIMKLHIMNLEGTKYLELLSPSLFGSKSIAGDLQELEMNDCRSLEVLVVDSLHLGGAPKHGSLPRLERLELWGLILLEEIIWRGVTPKEFLPSLCSLMISNCNKLKTVSWVFQLPNLEFLCLCTCNELEMLAGDEEDNGDADTVEKNIAFPRLRRLELICLPNLGGICSFTIPCPSLEYLFVTGCPKLNKLPFKEPNISKKLQLIRCPTYWWEDLEWEDDNTKSSLQKFQRDILDDAE